MLNGNETSRLRNLPGKQIARRNFSARLVAFFSGLGFAGTALADSEVSRTAAFPEGEEISRNAEVIHQQVTFNARPARVYEALTDAAQFNRVVQLGVAARTMEIGNKPVEIEAHPGGAFSAFGGYITGRQLELAPRQRIVQAWRVGSWEPGAYSIASFELSAQGSGTALEFHHAGFPQGDAEHLLAGWNGNYWEPLAKFLAGAK